MNDVVRESPNFYRDRLGVAITGVTLHSTRGGERTRGDPEAEFSAALDWLTRHSYQTAEGATYRNPSIHYIVGHDGRLARVVPERHGAWHAGTGADRRQPQRGRRAGAADRRHPLPGGADRGRWRWSPTSATGTASPPAAHTTTPSPASTTTPTSRRGSRTRARCGPARCSSRASRRGCAPCAARAPRTTPERRPP